MSLVSLFREDLPCNLVSCPHSGERFVPNLGSSHFIHSSWFVVRGSGSWFEVRGLWIVPGHRPIRGRNPAGLRILQS